MIPTILHMVISVPSRDLMISYLLGVGVMTMQTASLTVVVLRRFSIVKYSRSLLRHISLPIKCRPANEYSSSSSLALYDSLCQLKYVVHLL